MASPQVLRLRALWFSAHKWIGITLAILIIPLSISGSALVWRDGLDQIVHPDRYAVSGPARLTASAYAAAAHTALQPGERIASIRFPQGEGPVVVTVTSAADASAAHRAGPPMGINLWLDPATGRVLDRGPGMSGLVRIFHDLHGSLAVPGVGRTIVGIIGVAMFISCLTGLWLWWPVSGGVRRGFCWRRQPTANANFHHLLGLWVVLPLAMLSLTGALIVFSLAGGGGANRARQMRAAPLERPALTPDQAVALAGGGQPLAISWPTDQNTAWVVGLPGRSVQVDDATRTVSAARGQGESSGAVRRWHDGDGMGIVWQVIIFIAGLIPAILAVTGVIMWLRTRGWRGAAAVRKATKSAVAS